ncbi:MAG: HEAT repeat domain-containing protein, partial [Spirochaetaceae bacterium]|nr:HEAT repeat domain-containing protein [Spirochaetaceae bacterium]
IERNSRLAAASIRAIGKIPQENNEDGGTEKLLDRLIKEDPIAEDDLVAALIVTLGELQYEPAAEELVAIVEDTGGSAGHRRLACISLGKIGRSEDFKIVERIFFETEDATLRSYALAGLADFPDQETEDILIQALKRDSFWRIRVTAAEKLSGMNTEGINELLRYKASNDPVPQVRIASLKALGASGNQKNKDYLLDFFKDRKNGTEVRLACMSVLVEEKIPGTNDAVNSVMDDLWEKDEGRFLEFVCRDLSRSDWGELQPIYKRMLSHSNWLLQIYGVRGIRRNNILSLQNDVNELDKDGTDSRVRREVNSL